MITTRRLVKKGEGNHTISNLLLRIKKAHPSL